MTKSTPRDVFMYLLATITLYLSAYSFIGLLLSYIDAGFPDPLNPYFDPGEAIRFTLALLIIIFPVYLWVSRFLHRDVAADPGKQDLRIRKWLLYFTLFLAALLAIGDLVALLYNFLNGEITVRFLLKVLSVFAVAAAVFGYYLQDLRRAPGPLSSKTKGFVWGVLAAFLAIAVSGIIIAGSPFKQRLVRLDQQRVNDLQQVQWQLITYWQQKNKLPAKLDDLRDSISGFVPPVDPETRAAYVYRPTGPLSFELCADFSLASDAAGGGVDMRGAPYMPKATDNWMHAQGNQCFARTIDPDIYRPTPAK